MNKLNQQGYNLVELAIAVLILGVMASAVITARSYMAKQTVKNTDTAYATQKAIQMFEELKTLVNGNEQLGVAVLDNYSDGSIFDTVLTTDKTVDTHNASKNPGDPLSGNRTTNGNWRYLRQIQVNRVADDPNVRQVIIKVWRYAGDTSPNQPGALLATVGGILRTIQGPVSPTQVMDLYVLALNNVPGWWVQVPEMEAVFQDVIADIQTRNPGLEFRTHIISRTAYGRDQQYVPYVNQASGTDVTASPWVYLYPGLSPTTAGLEQFFYDPNPNGVQRDGTFNVDGTINNPSASQFSTCPNFSVADQYNHAVRYPDELATYQAVTAAWGAVTLANNGNTPCAFPEISERMLIEGMNSMPQSYYNAMIINLHGEMLPMPAMRNYSDAAKDINSAEQPTATPSVATGGLYKRVVTHPELLYYPATSASPTAPVNLRVYAYYDGFQDVTPDVNAIDAQANDTRADEVSIFLPDVTLHQADVLGVTFIVGNSTNNYKNSFLNAGWSWGNGAFNTSFSVPDSQPSGRTIGFRIYNPGPNNSQTMIVLDHTPLRHPPAPNNTGLNSADRLYGLEYIPCSPNITAGLSTYASYAGTGFGNGLTVIGGAGTPKNTARWIISLNMPVTGVVDPGGSAVTVMNKVFTSATNFIGQHIIETRWGIGLTNNTVPSNLSRTYVWVGNTNPPPVTEQFQFQGDPRHMPYLDAKVGGINLGGTQAQVIKSDGYNWYFKTLAVAPVDGYSGFDDVTGVAVNGWGDQHVEVDLPRYYQMIRQGLLNTTSIFAGINGINEFYFGFGGEMGSNQAPYDNGVKYITSPWNVAGTNNVCEILQNGQSGWVAAGTLLNKRVISNTANTWYERNWMGELYPDSSYNAWLNWGNLPSPANAIAGIGSKYYRKLHNSVATGGNTLNGFGREFGNIAERSANASFLNGTTTGTTGGNWFQQQTNGVNANIYALATTCYGIFQYPLGAIQNGDREWSINWPGASNTVGNPKPTEWTIAPYSTKSVMSIPTVGGLSRLFYDSDDAGSNGPWNGAGVVQLDTGTQRAYYMVSGLSPSASTGVAELGKSVLVFILRTFLDGGQMAVTNTYGHIVQLPLVQLYTNPVPQYGNPTSIPMVISSPVTTAFPVTLNGMVIPNSPVTDVWFRYPGVTSNTGNLYTEEYPNNALPLNTINGSTYYEPVSLIYNLKYSKDTGKTWYFMQGDQPTVKGVLDTTNGHPMTVTGANAITWYNWDVSNSANFPQGDYLMRVEAYRMNQNTNQVYGQHYSYHAVDITINR